MLQLCNMFLNLDNFCPRKKEMLIKIKQDKEQCTAFRIMNNIVFRKCRKRRKREMTERKRQEPRGKEKNMKACTKKKKRSNPKLQ